MKKSTVKDLTENIQNLSISPPENNYILELKTFQATTFKQVVDALKEILVDVNFEFDQDGLKILAMNTSHIVLIFAKMDADKFEYYKCLKHKYVGLNMLKLHMIIKTISNNDTLTLFIEENDPNKLGIHIENPEKNYKTTYKLSMLDIDVLSFDIPDVNFHTTINMPSVYFQKIIRDMHNIAEVIEIRSENDYLELRCNGEFCTQKTVIGSDTNNTVNIKHDETNTDIIQGIFSLKYIAIFTKCTNLCPNVEIYLKQEYPIIMSYQIANLGTIKLCLSQENLQA